MNTLKLTLLRENKDCNPTCGQLCIGTQKFCDTIEPPKTPLSGAACIPTGTYKLQMSYSPKFKTVLPELLNVPARIGVRIHAGNTVKDTSGCILVGRRDPSQGTAFIGMSRITLRSLMHLLNSANEKITLTIKEL